VNKWDLIFDFTEGKGKNFQFLPPSEFHLHRKTLEGLDAEPVQVFPYPERYGGTMADEDPDRQAHEGDGMMAFKIGVSQEEAARLMQQQEDQRE